MKEKILDGKFTIEIKDGYLEGGRYNSPNGVAVMKLFANESSVTLGEVAEAIKVGSFYGCGSTKIIDSNRFWSLKVYLEIPKSECTNVTYCFKIPNFQSEDDILPAIACDIKI